MHKHKSGYGCRKKKRRLAKLISINFDYTIFVQNSWRAKTIEVEIGDELKFINNRVPCCCCCNLRVTQLIVKHCLV